MCTVYLKLESEFILTEYETDKHFVVSVKEKD